MIKKCIRITEVGGNRSNQPDLVKEAENESRNHFAPHKALDVFDPGNFTLCHGKPPVFYRINH